MRCREPEKIFLPPEFPVLLTEAIELSALLAGQDAVVPGTSLTAVDTGLADPAGQAAGVQAKALGHRIAGEALLHAEGNGLQLLLLRELASGLDWVGHRWTI